MSEQKPDYHDADLMLRVYELRRESVMRTARDAINGQFWPKSYADCKAVLDFAHPMNTAWRQVASYWEMVFGIAKHGIVNPEFWVENNGEGVFLYAKVAPYLEQIRKGGSPMSFLNTEWAVTHTETGKRYLEFLTGRVKEMLESR